MRFTSEHHDVHQVLSELALHVLASFSTSCPYFVRSGRTLFTNIVSKIKDELNNELKGS